MRSCSSLLFFILTVATTKSQNQNFGTTHFPIYPQYYEDNDLTAEQFFYFDVDLLKEIANDQRDGNILISPLSIKSTLAMILEGAANESAEELRMALHLPNNERVREQFRKLLTEFERPKSGVHLQMANRVFMSKNLSPLDKYRDILTQYYYSNVTKVDFNSPAESAATINSWVNQQTHGIIPTLVDEGSFGGDVSILLANALYFKGIWEKAFNDFGTKTNCFYLSNGECQMTPMMDIVDNFKYDEVKKLDAKVIELPYAGGEYSMVIVLPNSRNGIQQLSRDIRTSINNIVHNLNETEVVVSLPRFKIDYSTDLVNYLPKVHVYNIIGPKAMLNGIVADVAVRVSNVLHKTHIEVNEEGTVAAAATGAVVIPLMGTTKPRFKADHPFLFFIRHTSTGTILFEGRLSIPERAYVQSNQQPRPVPGNNRQQPALQRPNQQTTFLNNAQNSPSTPQNNFQNPPQTSFQTSQASFQNPQVSLPSPTINFQNQQPTQFQSPAQTSYQNQPQQSQPQVPLQFSQSSLPLFQQTRDFVLKHTPILSNIPNFAQMKQQGQQMQADDANVNDLRNEQQNPAFLSNDPENSRIFYEGEVKENKHHQ